MKVGQPYRLGMQGVEVRRADHRVAMGGNVSIPLIVGDDQHNVGLCHIIGNRLSRATRQRTPSQKTDQNRAFHEQLIVVLRRTVGVDEIRHCSRATRLHPQSAHAGETAQELVAKEK